MTNILVVMRGFCVIRNCMVEQLDTQALEPDYLGLSPVSFPTWMCNLGLVFFSFSRYPILLTTTKGAKSSLNTK